MNKKIEKIAVLGSGVMGSQIAAHVANAGLPVLLFDMNQELSKKGLESALKIKPNAFFAPKCAELVKPCNYEDDLSKLSTCDWVIEVIAERIEWKTDLYNKISSHLSDEAILTSNTSGLQANDLIEGMDDELAHRFFITHFFNPPRYMKLVEIVKSAKTDDQYIPCIVDFLENKLGKGVVFAKDTPNFIANRIGIYGMMVAMDETKKHGLSIEDVDALTGTLIGRPKSATYRTADVVGLDTLMFVAKTAYSKCLDDDERELFKTPDFLQKMIENDWLGQKNSQGFYKKIDKGVIHSIDLDNLEYSPQIKKRFDGITFAKEFTDPIKSFNSLIYSSDTAGKFIWNSTKRVLIYCAKRLGEISDDIVSIDNAMKWGFAWNKGPFELWDDIGLVKSVRLMKAEGISVPVWIAEMIDNGFSSFYINDDGLRKYYCCVEKNYVNVSQGALNLTFLDLKRSNQLVKKNWSASIYDLGDEVAGIELHSILKADLNPIDGSIMETVKESLLWVKNNNYKGLVISSDSVNFSAGANLNLILNATYKKDYDSIEMISKFMQDICQEIRFAPFPVVAAPFGLVLGGGYELIGACDKVVAASESYIGLVEVGVGLIPGAGGNLRMLSNLSKKIKTSIPGAFPVVQKAFEVIGFAKVATSASKAVSYGYLMDTDTIIMNRDHLLKAAKDEVLKMAEGYISPSLETFKLPGTSGRLVIETSIKGYQKANKISEHDAFIGKKLAYVLTGGSKGGPFSSVDEQYLLDIEREIFVSLSQEQKTIERIEYMLKKGKPLRN